MQISIRSNQVMHQHPLHHSRVESTNTCSFMQMRQPFFFALGLPKITVPYTHELPLLLAVFN